MVQGNGDRTSEVLELARRLIRVPSVTNSPNERLGEVRTCCGIIEDFLREAGCEIRSYPDGKYPAIVAGPPGRLVAPMTLSGHFDVVEPDPDDGQFEPRIEGDYLWGRGAADMKTVVASNLVWLRDVCRAGPPYPPLNMILVGNEENGEGEPFGTPHVLADLENDLSWRPGLMIVGEREIMST